MVFGAVGLPVIFADKNAPADVGRFLNCRLPLAPFDYGKTCACLFRDTTHTQHLHSADKVVRRTHRLFGQIKAALWFCLNAKFTKGYVPIPVTLFLSFFLRHSCFQSF